MSYTFVYICRNGDNEELRYSIRSVVASFPDAKIWVVGGKPDWYTGPYIEVTPRFNKVKNAKNNMAAICSSPDIPHDFVLMNDDFYIMEKLDKLENYHQGTLLQKAEYYEKLQSNSQYTKYLWDTFAYLKKRGFQDPLNYEQHVPMLVNKSGLKNAIKPVGTLHRSIFGNLYLDEPSVEMDRDVKVYVTEPEKTFPYKTTPSPFLSSEDESFPILLKEVLSKKFNKKSKYEKKN